MLVDVRELYRAGVRLPREEVRRTAWVRGELMMQKYFAWHSIEVAPVFAALRPRVLNELDKVRVLRFVGRNLVLHGTQQNPVGRMTEQIWWCRFVLAGEDDPVTTPATNPADQAREMAEA